MNLILDTSQKQMLVMLETSSKFLVAPKTDKRHMESLLISIENLLEEAKTTLKNVDVLAVVTGPGSFTGIRIGVATAKAFSFVCNKIKIVPINILDLMAYVAKKQGAGDFSVLIKCTESKVYVGNYSNGNADIQKVMPKAELCKIEKDKFFLKDEDFFDHIKEAKEIKLTNEDFADFVRQNVLDENFVSGSKIEPLYLALSQAEEQLLKRENNGK